MDFIWQQQYDTGNEKIDQQHRMIFNAANMFVTAIRNNNENEILDQAFDLLLRYVNTHFRDEEKFYAEIGSSLLITQREEHRELLNDLRDIWHDKRHGSKDAGTDLGLWMERRLIPHIIGEDTRAQKAIH